MFVTHGRRHEHRRAGPLAGRDDPPGQGPRHLLHRRQPRRGRLQPGRARPLRARPQLPQPLRRRRSSTLLEHGPEPRHRHLHPRGRGDAPHRAPRARALAEGRRRKASATSPTSTCTSSSRAACSRSSTRSTPRTPGCSPPARRTCRSSCPAGRTRRSATSSSPTASAATSNFSCVKSGLEYMAALVDWYKDKHGQDESIGFFQIGGGIAGDFPICVVPLIQQDLHAGLPALGLLLPDLRLHHLLRLLQRRRAQREDHLGQARPSTRRASSSSPTPRSSRR